MQSFPIRLVAIGVIGMGATLAGSTSAAQQESDIAVSDPRPVAAAALRLESRFGWTVTYEDPLYLDPDEIVDVAAQVRNDGKRDPVLIPRGGQLSFGLPSVAANAAMSPGAVLQLLVDAYHDVGRGAEFRIGHTGSVFHILPSRARDKTAALQDVVAVLDRRISLPMATRSSWECLEALVAQTGDDTKVVIGTVPASLLKKVRIQSGAQSEVARTVLLRTLQATGEQLSWQLLCAPGPSGPCALNIHPVIARKPV